MTASPPLIGSLPLKKRTQRQGSPSGDPNSPGQQQQQSGSPPPRSPPPPPPAQPEHKFKVPAPYRTPGRVLGVRERARARGPDRSLGSVVAPTPLYYQFWDQSYLPVPRHHSSSVSSLASSGHVPAVWREQYSAGNGLSGDWMLGRHVQETLTTSPRTSSLPVNYLTRHPGSVSDMHGYTYRDSLYASGHRRPNVHEAESMAFQAHRGLGNASSTYQSNGIPNWEHWVVPSVRTNQLLYGAARVSRHDSFRRRKERYLGDEEYSKARVARVVPARSTSPGYDKPTNHGNTTSGLCVSDSSRAAKEYLSPHTASSGSGKSKRREEASKNSEVELPLLAERGSATKPRKHSTERKQSLSLSTFSASAFSLYSLQNFVVGSLIELSSGQHKRVEELQTEDFLVCADASPEIHLQSCTVRHISLSSSSPELAQVLIQLADQHTQDCLEVFVGFPFFVYGRGWASCCPQMTARLCGLGCHQLGVGDVCLALSPSPGTSTPATSEALVPQENQEQREDEKKEKCSQGMAETRQKERTVRKRHNSAPQFCTMDWSEHLKQR